MKKISNNNFSEIIISRTDKIGDIILTLPLISAVKSTFISSKIIFLASRRIGDLLDGYNQIDELVFIEDFIPKNSLLSYLKTRNIDISISVFPRAEIDFAFYRAEIKIRIGTGFRLHSFLFNKRVYEHRKYAEKHESEYNLNLLKSFVGEIKPFKNFHFEIGDGVIEKVEEKLKRINLSLKEKFIIIHPGSKGSAVDLPVEKFRELINKSAENFKDFIILLTGSDSEKKLINDIINESLNNLHNLAGIFTLKELLALINYCSLFISNSTGPIHMAGAINKNIIGFYPNSAPMNAIRWKPLSENSVIFSPVRGDDMNSISVDDVINKMKHILLKEVK